MKAMYCEICGTITSPGPRNFNPRTCSCGTHRCWWVDGSAGVFRVQDMALGDPETGKPAGRPKVWILGISNSFLHHPREGSPTKEDVQIMLEQTPSSYIFKQTMSNIIRIRPGQSGDTGWAVFEEAKPSAPG